MILTHGAKLRWMLLAVLASGIMPAFARADTVEQLFAEANRAYFANDFPTAVASYERLLELGIEDPDVTYNLATAHARRGAFGQAIRYYERTLRLDPSDDDADANLQWVRDELGRRQARRRGEAIVEARPALIESLVVGASRDLLAVTFVVLESLFFALLLIRRKISMETPRLALAIAAPIALVLAIASGSLLGVKTRVVARPEGIVISGEVPLREGPDLHASVRATLFEGTRVTMLGGDGRYIRVRTADGREGWAPRDDVGRI